MIPKFWRGVSRLLGSAALALWLLVFATAWSIAATAVPQVGTASEALLRSWAAEHAALEPVVRAVGLHSAFSSPVFLACSAVLAMSTAICSWRRTKVAIARARELREAACSTTELLVEQHDFDIPVHSFADAPHALHEMGTALDRLGVRMAQRGDMLVSVSPWWSVWGSAIFHWALLALMLAAFAGTLVRSEGSMYVPVGEAKPDVPASYRGLDQGRLRAAGLVHRSIRVDAFNPDLKVGGIDRGAVPTVSVLDGSGRVLISQQVYPNQKLHSGSLSINAPGCGLTVKLGLLDSSGRKVADQIMLVDFSQTATEGTIPLTSFGSHDSAGNSLLQVYATVPLDRVGEQFGEWIPSVPRARVVVTDRSGQTALNSVIEEGQTLRVPGAGSLRLEGIGWFSRLSLVDDPTIPFVYGSMIIAMLGLIISLATRQQLLLVSYEEGPGGPRIVVRARMWRNSSVDRQELREELTRTFGAQ